MGVRLPTAAEIENLQRVLEEEEHRRLERENMQLLIESVESKTDISVNVEETVESTSTDVVSSMTTQAIKTASHGKPKKR